MGTSDVSVLPEDVWAGRISRCAPSLPFAASHWLHLGRRADPRSRFLPLSVSRADGSDVLVPAFVTARDGVRIGCFGYGTLGLPTDPTGVIGLPWLAERVRTAAGAGPVRTLLPPPGSVPALERTVGGWPSRPGPRTYLLDLSGGAPGAWRAARGKVRTAVRRAREAGLRAVPGGLEHASALADGYSETMARHGRRSPYRAEDLRFLPGASKEPVSDTVTCVVPDAEGLLAASVFAFAGSTAFHIMQVTSQHGRRVNAGHLALFSALEALAARGVRCVDLGSAAGPGQEFFKQNWGGEAATTRLVHWPQEES
ncbi:GNAT family N-acetyltransferase [Streptomyces sp. NPDC088789]|uniref:GNAT family N-acetyltransferase n=1 Tax=Streptomyces sp. NPDC088789 TaxID=3365899 RepID=UPI003827582C